MDFNMAMELVGGALLSSLFQTLFERITSREVIDFFREKKLNDELLKKMKTRLVSANVLLNDAENKQIVDPNVKFWLEDLREVILEADELLDEIETEDLQRKQDRKYRRNTGKGLKFTYSFSRSEETVEHRMEKILDRLQDIEGRTEDLGLKVGVQNASLQRIPAPLLEESAVCGRDSDKEYIIKLLLSNEVNDNKISVIPIVGMGGIGKTTLAQLVYNDTRVRYNFDIKTWVTISDDFDIFKITKLTFEGVSSQYCNTGDLCQLQNKLKETLMGKRFLIVYDDVWNENYNLWDVLKSPLESGASGSKIILTTRSEIVASMVGNFQAYKLQAISDEDCWKLFVQHAFYDANLDEHSDLQEIGREIVGKCKGHPLAIKSLARLLRSVRNPKEWRNILNNEIWELQLRESLISNILPALWLSYRYLPPNLKRCFAYCSIFPKDYIFIKEKLILMWMAEGFLQPENGKRMEDVGNEYFQDLISRSLFQRLSEDESTITMHDIVHDLAIFVSGEFSLRLEDDNLHEIPQKVRHLSYFRKQHAVASKFDPLYGAKNLHTLLLLELSSSEHFLVERVLIDLLPRLRSLRVLSLSHYSNVMKLPDSIGNLIYLRYLDLSHTTINMLPASICSLYNLQTLLLLNCASLTELPPEIGRLVNLRHLHIGGTNLKEMPHQMSGLKNLQTLTMFVLGKGRGSSIKDLKHFQNLRGKLSISGLQNIVDTTDVLEANFKDKKHIVELVLEWDCDSNVDSQTALEVLEKTLPHVNLKKLTIGNYDGEKFPHWLGDPLFSNIGFLSLTNCRNCTSLPPLGQLPSLKELSIIGFDLVAKVDCGFYGRDNVKPFCSLEVLKFEDMVKWEEWLFAIGENESGTFPCLRELHIVNCPKLRSSLPVAPALCQLDLIECEKIVLKNISPQLQWLTIIECSTVVSLFEEVDCSKCSLKELNISRCPSLKCFLKGGPPQTLKAVEITDCRELELPICYSYAFLESLSICGSCDSITVFPLHLFPKLNRLHIDNCQNLKSLSLPGKPQVKTPLNFLQISRCPNFFSFPEGGISAHELKWLWIDECKILESLPQQMDSLLYSLQVLYVRRCPELGFPKGGLPSNLNSLSILSCDKFVAGQTEWNLQRLPSLEYFSISSNCDKLDLESFPQEGQLPFTLLSLHILGICNLKSLDHKGLQHLNSLKELKILDCPKLQSIPYNGLPSSLNFVHISNCPLLKKKRI